MRAATIIDGGPRERALIFRRALAEGRTVSVGYRKGGNLEVRDLTGMELTFIRRGYHVRDYYGALHFFEGPHYPVIVG